MKLNVMFMLLFYSMNYSSYGSEQPKIITIAAASLYALRTMLDELHSESDVDTDSNTEDSLAILLKFIDHSLKSSSSKDNGEIDVEVYTIPPLMIDLFSMSTTMQSHESYHVLQQKYSGLTLTKKDIKDLLEFQVSSKKRVF